MGSEATPSVKLLRFIATRALGLHRKGPKLFQVPLQAMAGNPSHLLGCPTVEGAIKHPPGEAGRQAPVRQGGGGGCPELSGNLLLTFSSYSSRVSTVSQRKSCFRSTSSLKDCRGQMEGQRKGPNFNQAIYDCYASQHPEVPFRPCYSLEEPLRPSGFPGSSS